MYKRQVLAAADTTSAAEEVAEVTQDTVEEVSRMTQILQDLSLIHIYGGREEAGGRD